MVERKRETNRGSERRMRSILENLDIAYDLSSVGMGVQFDSVAAFALGSVNEWQKGAVLNWSSNYTGHPYALGWLGNSEHVKNNSPKAVTPFTPSYVQLFEETEAEYDRLGRAHIRIALGDATPETSGVEGPLVDPVEYRELLISAAKKGLILFEPPTLPEVEVADKPWKVPRSLLRVGIEVPDSLLERFDAVQMSEAFRERTLRVATYKLGCMLALTDQLTWEAQALGQPVAKAYRPSRNITEWSDNWHRVFGRPMPSIDGLYQEAHAVFRANTDPNDSLVVPIRYMSKLHQLTD